MAVLNVIVSFIIKCLFSGLSKVSMHTRVTDAYYYIRKCLKKKIAVMCYYFYSVNYTNQITPFIVSHTCNTQSVPSTI